MSDETENQTDETENTQAAAEPSASMADERVSVDNLRVLENIEVIMTVEVGNTEIKIRDLLRLNEGSVIELDRLAGDPLDILVNGTIIAAKSLWSASDLVSVSAKLSPLKSAWKISNHHILR